MKIHLKILTLAILISSAAHAFADSKYSLSRDRVWVDRPWEIRYVLFFSDASLLKGGIGGARKYNADAPKHGTGLVYLSAEEMYEPTSTFKVPGKIPQALILIKFDKSGHAKSKSVRLSKYTAKQTMLDNLVLVKTNFPTEEPYHFAEWSLGIPGEVSFSPAVCDVDDVSRYEDDWQDTAHTGTFGCREWTAQLYNAEQPYIDVTSYTETGSFIGRFVGWSRFSDPSKPVIGLHGTTWLCLHECPAGEAPGIIPSIEAWTAKHHFPMPLRPRKQPEYPNSDFQDAINE